MLEGEWEGTEPGVHLCLWHTLELIREASPGGHGERCYLENH